MASTGGQDQNAKSKVLSLAKGMRVLEVFSPQARTMSLSEIAAKARLDAGTAFRFIKTLVELGYLGQTDEGKRYFLELKVLDLGFNAIAQMDPHDAARPILRSLVGHINEAASIGVLYGSEAVYVDRVQAGMARLGVDVRVGSRIAIYCSALGHALIAHLPKGERLRLLNAQPRPKLTPSTPVSLTDIEARLARVRELGYAVSDQDTVVGLRVIAAPIMDTDGNPYAALSVAAPVGNRSLKEFVDKSAGPVVQAAQRLSKLYRTRGGAPLE
jgi:IclR family transcriptional regulator, pca regulon regulatory protein